MAPSRGLREPALPAVAADHPRARGGLRRHRHRRRRRPGRDDRQRRRRLRGLRRRGHLRSVEPAEPDGPPADDPRRRSRHDDDPPDEPVRGDRHLGRQRQRRDDHARRPHHLRPQPDPGAGRREREPRPGPAHPAPRRDHRRTPRARGRQPPAARRQPPRGLRQRVQRQRGGRQRQPRRPHLPLRRDGHRPHRGHVVHDRDRQARRRDRDGRRHADHPPIPLRGQRLGAQRGFGRRRGVGRRRDHDRRHDRDGRGLLVRRQQLGRDGRRDPRLQHRHADARPRGLRGQRREPVRRSHRGLRQHARRAAGPLPRR